MRAISARISTRSFASRFESGSSMRNACGFAHDRAAHRDPLPLPAGERPRLLVQRVGRGRGSRAASRTRLSISSFGRPRILSANAMFRSRVHVRIERVVLEDHRDVAVLRRHVVDDLTVDHHLPGGDRLESGDHPQRGRLPAAGRPDEHDELAVGDLEVEVGHRLRAVGIDLRQALERDLGHRLSPRPQSTSIGPRPWRRRLRGGNRPVGAGGTLSRAAACSRHCSSPRRSSSWRSSSASPSGGRSTSASRTRSAARSPATGSASTTSRTPGRTRTSAARSATR